MVLHVHESDNKTKTLVLVIIPIFSNFLNFHNVSEVAHDCVAALKNWFVGRGIKNSYDTWHGKYIQEGNNWHSIKFRHTHLFACLAPLL